MTGNCLHLVALSLLLQWPINETMRVSTWLMRITSSKSAAKDTLFHGKTHFQTRKVNKMHFGLSHTLRTGDFSRETGRSEGLRRVSRACFCTVLSDMALHSPPAASVLIYGQHVQYCYLQNLHLEPSCVPASSPVYGSLWVISCLQGLNDYKVVSNVTVPAWSSLQ